ncbi:MAG: aminotransferase class IV [Gemmatimonadales bacterium]|jgi:D-alanine transaminase|nr:aminotransferase class IV [Gemmatimonadales bacterium]
MTVVYLNGHFMPEDQALISPLDRGFLFGDSVYEVIRAYRGLPFRIEEHFARLAYSLGELRIGAYLSPLKELPSQLIAENDLGGSNALVYIQVTRGVAPRSHAFPPPDVKATIYGRTWAFEPPAAWSDPGLSVILVPDVRWSRCDIKVTALTANVLAHQRAVESGAHEALLVRDGVVLEGTLSSLFGVFEGEVRTAPLSNYILPSITRALVLELCRTEGIPVREVPIYEHEIHRAEELFVASTVHEVGSIHDVQGRALPAERPVTDQLQRLFRAAVERECA